MESPKGSSLRHPGNERSEEARSVMDWMDWTVREREYVCLLDFFGGGGAGLLGGCTRTTGDFSALLAVNQLEEKVEQEVAAKDANRQKNCEGHGASRGQV